MPKIQIKRGSKAKLPTLAPGEFGLATDAGELYIGGAGKNLHIPVLGDDGKLPPSELPPMDYDPAGSATAVQKALTAHTGNKDNPHAVTAEQVGASRAVKGTYPIAEGQSIQAGDVVDVVEGQLQKTVTAVPNVNTVVNKTAYAELQMVHLSKGINVQIYMNSSGGTMYANILNDNGGVGLKGQNLGMDMEAIAAVRLNDTQFILGYILDYTLYAMVGTVDGEKITLGTDRTIEAGGPSACLMASLDDTHVFIANRDTNNELEGQVFSVSSNTLNPVGSPVALKDYTMNGGVKAGITKLLDDDSGSKRLCVCFWDRDDGGKGKAVIVTIGSSNTVTWGDVVTYCDQVGYAPQCCAVGEKVIATGYYNDTKLCLLGVTGNQITVLHNGNALATSQTGAIAAISDNQAVFITAQGQKSKAVALTVNGNALEMGAEFDFARSTAATFALTVVSNKRLLAAYSDLGNSKYGTVTTLTVSGNQIAGDFVVGSKDAIALKSGTAGQSIEVIYSGTVAADWVTEGQVISSPGVYGAGVLDGVLQVWSKERPGQAVTGRYVGTGAYGRDNPNSLTFPQPPKMVVCVQEFSDYAGGDNYGFTWVGNIGGTAQGTKIFSLSGNTLSWYNDSEAKQANQKGRTYYYTAIF